MKNTEEVFPWKENESVKICYGKENCKIIETGNLTGRAIIFFSSNGLYFPNDEEIFSDVILRKDRYEWTGIGRQKIVRNYYEKIVYVRDIYKQWYIKGINSTVNSIDKLILYLSDIVDGYTISTCGISAGGYAACIIGEALNANIILNISGQVDLSILEDPGPFVEKAVMRNDKYINIVPHVDSGNHFYFYPAYSKEDIEQKMCMDKCNKVHKLGFDSATHGETMEAVCLPYVLTMEKTCLEEICNKYENIVINKLMFVTKIVPGVKKSNIS